MSEKTLFLGCHLSTSGGYLAMGRTALEIGANTFAFFTRNPRGGNAKPLDAADVSALRELMDKSGFGPLVAHAPYTMNLCSAKAETVEFARRAMAEQLSRGTVFDAPQTVRHFLQLHLAAKSHEVFAVLFLDSQNQLIAMEELFRGTLTQTSVYPREVVIRALHHHCAAVVLAHNHPSGNIQPSQSDIQLTQHLKSALALVDVRVLDHFIVAPGAALSLAEEGQI